MIGDQLRRCRDTRRPLTAVLALLVGLLSIVTAFHDHDSPATALARIEAPAASSSPLPHHECLACKISPPFATPATAPTVVDPGLIAAGQVATGVRPELHGESRLTSPPRAPPALSLA